MNTPVQLLVSSVIRPVGYICVDGTLSKWSLLYPNSYLVWVHLSLQLTDGKKKKPLLKKTKKKLDCKVQNCSKDSNVR